MNSFLIENVIMSMSGMFSHQDIKDALRKYSSEDYTTEIENILQSYIEDGIVRVDFDKKLFYTKYVKI